MLPSPSCSYLCSCEFYGEREQTQILYRVEANSSHAWSRDNFPSVEK